MKLPYKAILFVIPALLFIAVGFTSCSKESSKNEQENEYQNEENRLKKTYPYSLQISYDNKSHRLDTVAVTPSYYFNPYRSVQVSFLLTPWMVGGPFWEHYLDVDENVMLILYGWFAEPVKAGTYAVSEEEPNGISKLGAISYQLHYRNSNITHSFVEGSHTITKAWKETFKVKNNTGQIVEYPVYYYNGIFSFKVKDSNNVIHTITATYKNLNFMLGDDALSVKYFV